jgi:hypothetical protein
VRNRMVLVRIYLNLYTGERQHLCRGARSESVHWQARSGTSQQLLPRGTHYGRGSRRNTDCRGEDRDRYSQYSVRASSSASPHCDPVYIAIRAVFRRTARMTSSCWLRLQIPNGMRCTRFRLGASTPNWPSDMVTLLGLCRVW